MTRIHSRLLGAVGLTASAALLTGCAVLGGDAGSAGIVSDDDLSTSYGLVQPGVLTVCSDIPYPPFEFEEKGCLLYTSPSPRDGLLSRMPSSA